jgi:hypothetical protein
MGQMNKKQAVRNMLMGVLLVGLALTMGGVAIASIRLVMSLPR